MLGRILENETCNPKGFEMNIDIRKYAKLGLVHHLLYPDCTGDSGYHAETLREFLQRTDIETLDCCLPYGNKRRQELIPLVRNCGKSVCFAIHLYPLRSLPLAAISPATGAQRWMIVDDMIEQAAAIGAEGFIFGSGVPSYHEAERRDFAAFAEFCSVLCSKLKPHNMTAMLEPFDMDIDKKFLYGPIDACVNLADRISEEHDNFGFELDVAHLPLMREDSASAIRRTASRLKRVHLGNCVLKDKHNPRWGDTHPPIGFRGGEIDVPELAVILKALLDVGFLNTGGRGNLVMEMTPFPGLSVDDTVADSFERLEKAWRLV